MAKMLGCQKDGNPTYDATGQREQTPVLRVVIIAKKGLLSPIAALSHMMRQPRYYDSWKSCHRLVNCLPHHTSLDESFSPFDALRLGIK
jgi:hypothetical protein